MMLAQARSTFKLDPTSGLTQSVRRALKIKETAKVDVQDTGSLIEMLLKRLESYPFALVRSNSFSLINVTTNLGKSFGYSEVIFSKRRSLPSTSISFTFAVIPNPAKKVVQDPVHTIELIDSDFMFGTSRNKISYLVITLDHTEDNTNLSYQMLKHLEFLYNIVGLTTKSFVSNPRGWWESSVYVTHYQRVMYDRYYSRSPELLFKDTPIGFWIYNKHVWQDYSHLILPRLIDENFYTYFVLFILDTLYIGEQLDNEVFKWIYGNNGTLSSFIASGIKRLLMDLKSGYSDDYEMTDSVSCVLHLLYRYVEPEGLGLDKDRALSVYKHLVNKTAATNSTNLKTRDLFYKMFSGVDRLSYELLDKDASLQRLAELLFGDLP